MSLRNKLIRLAHSNPELRKDLLPLIADKTAIDKGSFYGTVVQVVTVHSFSSRSAVHWFKRVGSKMKRSSKIINSEFEIDLMYVKLNEGKENALAFSVKREGDRLSIDPNTGLPDQNKNYISAVHWIGDTNGKEVKRFGFDVTSKEIIQFVEMFINKHS